MGRNENCSYALSITDSVGTEQLERIEHFRFHKFPDDTKEINLRLYHSEPGVRIEINFDLDRTSSKVSVRFEGPNARETANGVLLGILQIIASNKTHNFIYDPWSLWVMSGVAIIAVRLASLLPTSFDISGRVQIGFQTFLLLELFVYGVSKLRPYITFDTRRNQSRAKLWNWLVLGVGSSLMAALIIEVVKRSH